MRMLMRYAIAIAVALCGRTGLAQNPLYSVPGLGGYVAAREANQIETLRVIQQYRMLQEGLLLQQQRQAVQQEMQQQQREEQRRMALQRRSQIEEIQANARKSIADKSKGACVDLAIKDPDTLSKMGLTVGQLCGCVEAEMLGMLTLDLSGKILLASAEFAGDGERFIKSPAGQEYAQRFVTAMRGCSDRLRNR